MTAAIVPQSTPSVDLSEIVLSYLQAQQDAAPSMAFIEAMCSELAAIETRTGDSELDQRDLRYAYLIAADEPVGSSDLPPCLWP
jgi:hypothetical protein